MAVCIAILLLSSLASAETNRQKVVKEACYALDQGTDYVCGETVKTSNWNYLNSDVSAYEYMRDKYYNDFSSLYWNWNAITKKYEGEFGDPAEFGYKNDQGHGGQCKYFANLVTHRAGQKGSSEIDKFEHYDGMINTPHNVRTNIGQVEPGDVIFYKFDSGLKNSKGGIIYRSKPYTVLNIPNDGGNSLQGTVTKVEARDRTGAKKIISGDELEKYNISRYARGIEFAQPGDVIFDTWYASGSDHTAIVAKITGGNFNDGTVSSLDVVDSNWCQGGTCEIIQYHAYPTSTHKIEEYFVYTGVGYYNEKWEPYNPNLVMYWNPISNNDIRNGRVYEIKRDSATSMKYAHWIINGKVLSDLGYGWDKVKYDIFSRISLFMSIPGENIVFKNGILIEKNDGTIYEMRNGEKRGFTSWQSYLDHGYNANTPRIKVSDTEANAIPTGLVMGYKLLRATGYNEVYLVQGNEKRHIPNTDVFSFWGFNWADVKEVSKAEIDSYANKGNLYRTKYGTIIGRSSSETGAKQYFVSIDYYGNLYRRHILNIAERNYLWVFKTNLLDWK